MEIKKYIEDDLEYVKELIENELDDNLRKIVDISLKNIERVERVEVNCKLYELNFYIIFYKDLDETTDFIILDENCGIFNFEKYSDFVDGTASMAMSNRLLDIICNKKYLVEQ